MWWNSDACRGHADWRASASWQPDTWWPHADWHWCASWQPDTRSHHADSHWRAECPEVFDAAAGLLTDVLAQGLHAARLGRVAVAAACATTAPPAAISPGGDESGGIGRVEQASMASAYRGVAFPTALGPAHDGVGQGLAWRSHVSYGARSCAGVRTCAGCGIRFSCHKVIEAFCCSVCRRTKGGGHSSGTPTCKRELPEVVGDMKLEVTTDGSSGPDWDGP